MFPFCLDVPILGQEKRFIKGRESEEGRESHPKHFGMKGDNVNLEG